MEPTSLTIEILKDIRDEVHGVRDEVRSVRQEMGARIDATNTRIDGTNERLEVLARRVVESEIRTSTAITDLAGNVRELTTVLRAQSDLRPRVERCEHEIEALKHGSSGR
jgi:chromosome segregation ATPase